ncbi:unnamed protein product, partial [Polarella glacialis]
AYNNRRHGAADTSAQADGGKRLVQLNAPLPTPSASNPVGLRSPQSPKPGAARPSGSRLQSILESLPGGGANSRAGYNLLRSDIEEEANEVAYSIQLEKRFLPEMPRPVFGVRQRSWLNMPVHDDETNTLEYHMAWVESNWFAGTSGGVIMINAIIIGWETDVESPWWFYVEQSLLSYFVFELFVRLLRHGCNFFRHEDDWVWNLFDFSIVMSGVFDQWMMPFLRSYIIKGESEGGGSSVGNLFMIMRMARLLRIVRLFRLVKIIRPLYELAMAVVESLQGMFWVLVFMMMTLYSVAILCTRLIGHGAILNREELEDPEIQSIQEMFSTVEASMFTLFGTVSGWSLMKFVPIFNVLPILRPFFVIFYIYSAWALLAVMTGVVSENMIAIRETMIKEDEQREEMRKTVITNLLIDLFREADADNSNTVSRAEFDGMLRSPDLVKKITSNTRMQVQDLKDLFDWLDHDGSGTITIDEFMAGFKWMNEPLRAKSLVKLQERLLGDMKSLETSVAQAVEKRVQEMGHKVAAPLKKVHAIAEQMQRMDVSLSGIRQSFKERAADLPTQQQLRDMESRLTGRLAQTISALQSIEVRARATLKRRKSVAVPGQQ